jgi:hypothetical protein
MGRKRNPTRFKTILYWVFGIVAFIITMMMLIAPPLYINPPVSNRIDSSRNAKSLGIALFSFEDEFGSYPCDATTALINKSNPNHGYNLSGHSSNALFRQLFATQMVESEHLFYVDIKGRVKPDDNITPGEVLKKGEVGFSYISGLSSKGNPSRPLLLCPLIPGTTKFDPKPFDGKAIVLRIDNTLDTYTIHDDGHVYDKDGLDILSPNNPIWNGKAPDIRYPE